ncbi:MAG: hypothetical protein ABWY09_01615 [Stenotrophomonas maltophilia]
MQVNTAGKAAWIVLAIAWLCFLIPVPGLGLFIGWPLNLVAFILAIVAIAKGGAMKGLIQLLLSLIGSPIVYFIGVAIFAGAVGALDQSGRAARENATSATQVERNAAVTPSAVPAIEVTAQQLHQDYEANEIAADAKYKGKTLLISGTVESIESDFMDKPTVHLTVGDFAWVQLSGISKDVAASLSKGARITAQCKGAGEVIGFPAASDCILQ